MADSAFSATPIDDYRNPRLPSARDDLGISYGEAQAQQALANGGAFGPSGGFLSDLGEGARNWWDQLRQFPSSLATIGQAAFTPSQWGNLGNAAYQTGKDIVTAPFASAKNILDTQAYEREKGLPIIPQTSDLLNVGFVGGLGAPAALAGDVGSLGTAGLGSVPKAIVPAAAREISDQGFYSPLLEAAKNLKQAKGSPDQMVKALANAPGVSPREIEATGLPTAFADQKSISKDDLINHLRNNGTDVRGVTYGGSSEPDEATLRALTDKYQSNGMTPDQAAGMADRVARARMGNKGDPRWSSYSLDPSNPTYQETVLHLPLEPFEAPGPQARFKADESLFPDTARPMFTSGHWSEPNVVAHIRSSIQPDETGSPNYVVNELQSDWGQKLREGGVRDEAKIAALKEKIADTEANIAQEAKGWRVHTVDQNQYTGQRAIQVINPEGRPVSQRSGFRGSDQEAIENTVRSTGDLRRLNAELETAQAATPGHPLVNSTDSWVNLGLRHALKQAVDSGASHIAIPSGGTVLNYGMGGEEEGMKYAYDQMYPKNLKNILRKMDPYAAMPEKVDDLYPQQSGGSERAGMPLTRSSGFTRFPITPKVKAAVKAGMPLYSNEPKTSAALSGITAYHGSPYDFNRFDNSKIGTGEGAQAYGHGHYLAEAPNVASGYRDRRSGANIDARNYFDNGALVSDLGARSQTAQAAVRPFVQHPDQARAIVNNIIDGMSGMAGKPASAYLDEYEAPNGWEKAYQAGAKALGNLTYKDNPGSLYTVSIDHQPEEFLDWDKPLGQQSQHVTGALKSVYPEMVERNAHENVSESALPTGQWGTERLRNAGIAGIRYLDQGSRGNGNGTYNYVVFNPDKIRITHKNGVPISSPEEHAAAITELKGGDPYVSLALTPHNQDRR